MAHKSSHTHTRTNTQTQTFTFFDKVSFGHPFSSYFFPLPNFSALMYHKLSVCLRVSGLKQFRSLLTCLITTNLKCYTIRDSYSLETYFKLLFYYLIFSLALIAPFLRPTWKPRLGFIFVPQSTHTYNYSTKMKPCVASSMLLLHFTN